MTRKYLRQFRKQEKALAHEEERTQERIQRSFRIAQTIAEVHPLVLECLYDNECEQTLFDEVQFSDAFMQHPNNEKVD
jgi:hypothetical protein